MKHGLQQNARPESALFNKATPHINYHLPKESFHVLSWNSKIWEQTSFTLHYFLENFLGHLPIASNKHMDCIVLHTNPFNCIEMKINC